MKKKWINLKAILIICLVNFVPLAKTSQAEIIESCGEASGKAFIFSGGNQANGYWADDGYTGVTYQLIKMQDGNYDIDLGSRGTIRNGGGVVIPISDENPSIFLVSFPAVLRSTIEIFVFDNINESLSILQYGWGINEKASVFIAPC